jgi:hypothetical protein
LLVYGNGDGGGGPLAGMIERLKRMENVDGLAKVKMGSANEFYESIEKSGAELSSWKGELVGDQKHNQTWSFPSQLIRVFLYSTLSCIVERTLPMLSPNAIIDPASFCYANWRFWLRSP